MAWFERARRHMPGGVNSPVRAWRAVGGMPWFARRGQGAWVEDVDGNRRVDYVLSYGPLIAGHAHPAVVEAVAEAAKRGTSFGFPTPQEVELAELICKLVPSIEMVRLVNSGTEATMSALRVARGFTGRDLVVKFVGCYHGHVDALLVRAGSGAATLGVPDSAGVPADTVRHTLVLPYNDLAAVEDAFARHGDDIAAVIVEPVAGNMGCVPPVDGFLDGLRRLTSEHGALLVFDEVMTGFRVGVGGAQERYGVRPDLTCLGKVIGGGLPVGAYGGRADIMRSVAPLGPVYQAGTLSGNPLSVAAGLATLRLVAQEGAFDALEARTEALCQGLERVASAAGVPVRVQRVGTMFTVFFTDRPVRDFDDASHCDKDAFTTYFRAMAAAGVSLPPSPFEACFTSLAHGDEEIELTLDAAAKAMESVAAARGA